MSRAALEQDDSEEGSEEDEDEDEDGAYDDPETADLVADTAQASDSEISSDNALGESDAERFEKFVFRGSSKPKQKSSRSQRATAADFMSESDNDGDEGAELDDSEEDDDMDDGLDALINGVGDSDEEEDDSDDSEDEEEDGEEEDDDENEDAAKEESLKAKPSGVALSSRDAEKGMAIQKQRKMYDGLLNLRIRLQKALVAANTFSVLDDETDSDTEPYEAAEVAAIKLLNTISDMKENFGTHGTSGKRKRELEISTSSEDIWAQLQDEEEHATKYREDRLEKWSRKVQSVNVTVTKALGARNKTLVDALQDQLNNPDNRLIKRTKIARSCAPAQAAKKITDDENIYDDADFYQVLLKELVEQRTVDGANSGAAAVPSVVLTAAKDSKPRKVVDRKASKGRKMRFTVHEKLQNFMAPEDRRNWETEAIDRFFGTLFGRKLELNEEESDDEESEPMDEDFRIFGN